MLQVFAQEHFLLELVVGVVLADELRVVEEMRGVALLVRVEHAHRDVVVLVLAERVLDLLRMAHVEGVFGGGRGHLTPRVHEARQPAHHAHYGHEKAAGGQRDQNRRPNRKETYSYMSSEY